MKKSILLLFSVFLIGTSTFVLAQSLYDAAKSSSVYQKYKTGGIQAAQSEYNNLKANNTIKEIDFLFMLQLYGEQRQMQKVISVANDGLKKIPNSAPMYTTLGMAYYETKDYDKAIEAQSQSIKIKPSEPAYYNRGLIYYYVKKDYTKAIADFTNALKYIEEYTNENVKNEAIIDIYQIRALSFGNKKDFDKAIADYDMAIKLDSKSNPDLYFNRAVMKLNKANNSLKNAQSQLIESANKDFDIAIAGYQKNNNKVMCDKIRNYKQLQAVMSVIK